MEIIRKYKLGDVELKSSRNNIIVTSIIVISISIMEM